MIFNSQGDADAIAGFINGQTITPGDEDIILPAKSLLLGDVKILSLSESSIYEDGYNTGYEAGYAAGQAAALPYSKELQYIQSSGTQYINTGFKPNNNTRVICDFQIPVEGTTHQVIFGSRTTSSSNKFTLGLASHDNHKFRSDYGATNAYFSDAIVNTDRHTVDKNGNSCIIDGEYTATNTAETFTGAYALYAFAQNTGGSIGEYTSMRLYSLQIYDNGTLARDFIPVLDKSGVACLYDKVSGQLYYNQGSGSFSYAE